MNSILKALKCVAAIAIGFSFSCTSAVAQSTTDSALLEPLEVLSWHADLAERMNKLVPGEENFSAAITALEKLVSAACFESIANALRYNPATKKSICGQTIYRLLALDDTNPMAICARDGPRTTPCRIAYAHQKVVQHRSTFSPAMLERGGRKSAEAAFEAEVFAIEAKYRTQLEELDRAIYENERAYDGAEKKELKNFDELRRLYVNAATIVCAPMFLRIKEIYVAPTPTPAPVSALDPIEEPSISAKDEIEQMLQKLSEPPSSRKKTELAELPSKFTRERVLSPACFKYLEPLQTRYPASSNVQCFKHGFYTPQCLDAVLAESRASSAALNRQQNSSGGSSSSRSRDAFQSF